MRMFEKNEVNATLQAMRLLQASDADILNAVELLENHIERETPDNEDRPLWFLIYSICIMGLNETFAMREEMKNASQNGS